ncbi:TetR/AcrR family transcriptional regulator [Bacillus sp. 31A1R]|uniref:TetR/AcrR family transcriptional regulator n=1 Tax=Robertmurraya mangrovi TaxID=3098077 RepID=A0ABU5J2S9_9BACI|nr:TetR/AcrR family transcriptional regulator [Bacillus sp. 31A1R]MDZ5473662.1 TetR/AcrR family transcriptional regulator [Bacillus sp. 31A1R]
MNNRKQHVIKMAHQLFIDKGFQATSIQDILDYSGISKGTFYNYFSSKNELLIALFRMIYKKLEKERNELLIGQDPSDIHIFIEQINLHLMANRTNKLLTLFEEVLVSNDDELKQYIKKGQLRTLRWLYERFVDLFGETKRPYLLDCAIMFLGILHHNLKYYSMAHGPNSNIKEIVRYSVGRIVKVVQEVSEAEEQLIEPELLDTWFPDCTNPDHLLQQEIFHTVLILKKTINTHEDQAKYIELLDFIQNELLHSKPPRRFVIESALASLGESKLLNENKSTEKLGKLVSEFFSVI